MEQSASELYGYSRKEALGRVTHELLHTEFPEPLERITEQLHRDSRWSGELVHRRKDGTEIVVISRWVLDRDERGNRKNVLETNNDITQQKQSEKALRASENRLRTLTDAGDASSNENGTAGAAEYRSAEAIGATQGPIASHDADTG